MIGYADHRGLAHAPIGSENLILEVGIPSIIGGEICRKAIPSHFSYGF
jgi:hypothetical protein